MDKGLYYKYPDDYADGEIVCPNNPSHQLLISAFEDGEELRIERPSPETVITYQVGKFRCYTCDLDFDKEYRSTPRLIGSVVFQWAKEG